MGCCVGDCCVMDCGFCCVFDFCSDSGCGYHPTNNDTVDHSKKIADELAEMKSRAHEDGEKIGNEAFSDINQFMSQFVTYLKKINEGTYGGKRLNIKIDIIEREFEKLRQEVTNFVGNRMDDRLVLTDRELSLILEEKDDDERAKNFDSFYKKIHRKAVLDLSEKIEEVISKQFAIVDSEIRERLTEVDASMKKALNEYEQAERLKKENSAELTRKKIDSMYTVTVADFLLNELDWNAK